MTGETGIIEIQTSMKDDSIHLYRRLKRKKGTLNVPLKPDRERSVTSASDLVYPLTII